MSDRVGATPPSQPPLTSIRPQPRPERPPVVTPPAEPNLLETPAEWLNSPAVEGFSIESLPAGPGRLNLSLPANFNEGYNFAQPDLQFPDLNRRVADAMPPPAMTRGEFVDNIRGGLRDAVGEGAATVIEGAAVAAYILDRQGIEGSWRVGSGRMSAEVSARNGGKVEIGLRFPLGGSNNNR